MATNKVICGMKDLDAAIKDYESQGCSVKWQSLTGCAVMDCESGTPFNSEISEGSAHEGMDPAYADTWGEIPD